jgi:hypothetical protein
MAVFTPVSRASKRRIYSGDKRKSNVFGSRATVVGNGEVRSRARPAEAGRVNFEANGKMYITVINFSFYQRNNLIAQMRKKEYITMVKHSLPPSNDFSQLKKVK